MKRVAPNTFAPLLDSVSEERENCHYLDKRGDSVAAVSVCGEERKSGRRRGRRVRGIIFSSTHLVEIHPLTSRLREKAGGWRWADEERSVDEMEEDEGYGENETCVFAYIVVHFVFPRLPYSL